MPFATGLEDKYKSMPLDLSPVPYQQRHFVRTT
jgi:hypothetical protein